MLFKGTIIVLVCTTYYGVYTCVCMSKSFMLYQGRRTVNGKGMVIDSVRTLSMVS